MVFPNFCCRVSLPDITQQTKQQDKDPQDSDRDEPEGVNASADFDRQMRAELIRVRSRQLLCLHVRIYSLRCASLSYVGCVSAPVQLPHCALGHRY
jgi:hypothetical protein